ncbi:succinate dehydrogenase assembly factor 2 [Propylenella binzhouense]|uniref:FAD assembly factor SdhE n=1 Tax=Propylenella binzhouense TaxID=2555902 RepID=A0A964WST9_9HYPH|nr:succinate dehydrogenase assembly factor 2 [Propylenella binzhouense]MYZ47314.1 succinate dehydrogenase assembly factor 2 [Propylenella binzhouense]
MTGSTRSSHDLDLRRRRALYRAWHRGTREMDLILGRFADARIGRLDEAELAEFEMILDLPDNALLAWIMGAEPAPAELAGPVYESILRFQAGIAGQPL